LTPVLTNPILNEIWRNVVEGFFAKRKLNQMRLSRVQVAEFSTFASADMSFSPGINVLIGENSTGKSHMMKLLYTVLKSIEQSGTAKSVLNIKMKEKMAAVFRPDDGKVGRLVRRKVGRDTARVIVECTKAGTAKFSLSTLGNVKAEVSGWPDRTKSIFLPSREVLAMFENFIGTYQERLLSFDETYFDVCVALDAAPLRGPRGVAASKLFRPIEKALGGRVSRDGKRFYVTLGGAKMEAHLVAEGLRKLASLAYLVANGSLQENGVLFWDEPEANLNPRLITRVAEFLQALAESGVQVFVATHDYLLSQKLSLAKEFNRTKAPMKFFSFTRTKEGVVAEEGETISDLENNPILEEFAKHYEFEHQLLLDEQKRGG